MDGTARTRMLIVLSAGFEEGGVENSVVRVKPLYEELGYDIRVLTSDLEPALHHFSDVEFRSIAPDRLAKYGYRLFNPDAFRQVRRTCREFQPDVVSFHTMHQVTVAGLAAVPGVPSVVTVHGPEAFTPSLLPWYLPADDYTGRTYDKADLTPAGRLRLGYLRYLAAPSFRWAFHKVGAFVALSRYMQRVLAADGIEAIYVPNLVDPLAPTPLPSNPTLICAGRLEPFKGFHLAVAAMPDILREIPDARLVIAGEGVERPRLEKLVADLGLADSVELVGRLPRHELEASIAGSRVFVMPSVWPEAFGKAGVEAMSVGRPVVAADVGGVSEWLKDGVNGLLVPPSSAKELAAAVVRLLGDDALCQRMARAARTSSLQWDVRRYVTTMHLVHRDLIAGRSPRQGWRHTS